MYRLKFEYDLRTDDEDTARAVQSNIEESLSYYDGSFEDPELSLELYASDIEDEHGNSIYNRPDPRAAGEDRA